MVSVYQSAKLVAALSRVARVTAGLAESNGSLPPAGFVTHVTCRLTAKNQDQHRNHTLGNRVRATFTFISHTIFRWSCFALPHLLRPEATVPLPVPLLTPRTREWFLSYEHTRAVHSTITEPNSSSWTPVWTGASGYVCPVLVERQPSRFRFDAANQVATRRLTGSSCRRSARVSSGHVLWILLYRDRSFVRLGNAADEKVTQGGSKKEAVDFKRICR